SNTPTRGMSTSSSLAKLRATPAPLLNPMTATNVPNKNDWDTTSQVVRCPMRSSSCWICDAIMVSFVMSNSSLMVAGLLLPGVLLLPLPGFLDTALRRLLLASNALVALVLRRAADVDVLATVRVRVHVVLVSLVGSGDQPVVGQGLHVGDLLRSVRR